ncbi:MAG TPA: alpha/beta hydrolase [Burkholderiales bacterium]|nr:alpha/beta hydrolase [Burkholderiales bacterium]
MPPAAAERLLIPGPAGNIEVDVHEPGDPAIPRRGIALIAHPNPLQGGTKDNKVVTTLARTLSGLGYVAVRPNFRGVGATEGMHDQGVGETDDLIAVANYAMARFATRSLLLAGFSFGSFVQTRVAKRIECERMILVGPAVSRFAAETVPENTLVIHGELDDVVPLIAVLDWARPQNLPLVVVPGGEHFFHGRLNLLAQIVARWCA